ncbi:hypothetical protein LT966_32810, partial [Streptomyces griseobrunneus]
MVVDTRILRNPPEDPEVRQRMLHSHGLDLEVRTYVMATPGVQRLIRRAVEQVLLLLEPEGETGRRPTSTWFAVAAAT